MSPELIETILTVLARRGLTYLGVSAAAVSDSTLHGTLSALVTAGGLLLSVINEVYQARKLHKTQKEQGGVMPPAK